MNARPYSANFDRTQGRLQMSYGMGDASVTTQVGSGNPAFLPFTMFGDMIGGVEGWLQKTIGPYQGSVGTSVANAITPNPNPPTVTPGTGTPQLPSNYDPNTGTCGNQPCDTSTPATPISYTAGDPGTPDQSGSLILALCAFAGIALIFHFTGGRH